MNELMFFLFVLNPVFLRKCFFFQDSEFMLIVYLYNTLNSQVTLFDLKIKENKI